MVGYIHSQIPVRLSTQYLLMPQILSVVFFIQTQKPYLDFYLSGYRDFHFRAKKLHRLCLSLLRTSRHWLLSFWVSLSGHVELSHTHRFLLYLIFCIPYQRIHSVIYLVLLRLSYYSVKNDSRRFISSKTSLSEIPMTTAPFILSAIWMTTSACSLWKSASQFMRSWLS